MSAPKSPELTLAVGPEQAGLRVDRLVGALDAVGSRAEAQRLIEQGRVLVDGRECRKRHRVSPGERLTVRPHVSAPPATLEPEEVPLEIVVDDRHFLVVDKPPGVVTHPSKGHDHGTLVHGLLALAIAGGEDPLRPGIVHRLDRDTSGLLVVARSPRAHRHLQRLLRERAIERRYAALVHGELPPALTIDRPVGRDPRVRTRMSTRAREGREAITHLRLLGRVGRFSLVEARLETGRTHQIRVHLEAIGHPVVGDRTYGRRSPDLGLERQFLHAWYLGFAHPETGEPVVARSELPGDLVAALGRVDGGSALPRRPDR